MSLVDIRVLYENEDPHFLTFAWKIVGRVHEEIRMVKGG